MASDAGEQSTTTFPPEEAFSVLGNETRMEVVKLLGRSKDPLSFSELFDRVDYDTASNFTYHLDRLDGHFIRQTDDGYELTQRGNRVHQAVLSGAVTDSPRVEPAELDEECYHCGSNIWIDYRNQFAYIYCPGCDGNYGVPTSELVERLGDPELATELSVKATNPFPPALVTNRSPVEIHRTSVAWFHLEMLAWGLDLCPSCSATLDASVEVCETHDASDGLCDDCRNLQAVNQTISCTNCNYSKEGMLSYRLFSNTAMLDFITDHGLNPIAPASPETFWGYFTPYDETIRSVDPFEARVTFAIGDDAITLAVDDDLNVVDATRHEASGSR